jgi:1,2-phenylacetyl-CoA epoxidase catalytic subunit
MKVYTPEEMDPPYRQVVIDLMKKQMATELMTADIYGRAIRLAPTVRDKYAVAQFAREEVAHGLAVAELLAALGVEVEAELAQQLRRAVYTEGRDVGEEVNSWEELVVFNCVADRAGTYHLTDYRDSSYVPWARVMTVILEEEAGHLEAGEQGLEALCRDPQKRELVQQLINKWLPRMVRVFGAPSNPRNEYCLRVGLKLRTAGEEQTRFFESLVPLFRRCGLRLPDLRGSGLELTPEVSRLMAR